MSPLAQPERIRGLPYNISSDVWSLGLTILEVASNRFPFPPEGDPPLGPIDLLSYVVSMPVPELQDDPQAGVKWGRALRDFVERCLEKDPAKRPGPTKMLSHPFIKKSETRQPQPDIARFIADVWGWPAPPPAPGSEPSSTAATPTTTDAGILGRIPSVRKAPKPIAPLVSSKPSLSSLKIEQTSAQRGEPSPLSAGAAGTPPAVPDATQLDAEGRTAYERAEAKMREADVGLVGSPTVDAAGFA
jgi:mitogen-activated protein kinase kinase